jgi:hypothetical protein
LVREPIAVEAGAAGESMRPLNFRRVWFEGEWSVLADRGKWRVVTPNFTLDSGMRRKGWNDGALKELDGQRLANAQAGAGPGSVLLTFDLGGSLEMWPDENIEDSNPWFLISWNDDTVICHKDGSQTLEARSKRPPHHRYVLLGDEP